MLSLTSLGWTLSLRTLEELKDNPITKDPKENTITEDPQKNRIIENPKETSITEGSKENPMIDTPTGLHDS